MMPFHPDLIATVHDDRMDRRRAGRGGRTASPRRGEDVRWVRSSRTRRPHTTDRDA